ncbi:hypothetical protein [Piscibacillus salipiscarius]|nr:hypothetical protein [Piscibacillus salipiscarius]
MFKRIIFILILTLVGTESIIFAQEELVFEPLSSGNLRDAFK